MLKYINKYKKEWFLIFFICSLQAILWSASLLSLMFLYDSIVGKNDDFSLIVGDLGGVLIWILIFLLANAAVLTLSITSEILGYFCIEKMLLDIKFNLVNKINFLKYDDVDKNNLNVMSFLSNDINIIENNAFNLITKIYVNILCSIIFVGILFYFNWIIATISIFFFVLNYFLVVFFSKNTQKIGKQLNEAQENYSSKTKNILDGINTLFFANKLELLTNSLLVKYNDNISRANVSKVCKNDIKFSILTFTSRLLEILVIIISAVILYNQSNLTIGYNEINSVGAILSIATLANNLLSNSSSFSSSLISYHSSKPIFSKIESINILEEEGKDFDDDNLNFNLKNLSYEIADRKIFNKFSLKIIQNHKYALVGPSGSGKSTLAKLICGFLKPTGGEIYLNNQNLKLYKTESILKHIGYIETNPFILSDTVKNNITLYDKNFDNQKYNKIIKLLKLEAIDNDLIIDEIKNDLSVGQKQRINFARYLYNDYKWFILDEATSNLDNETSNLILEYLINRKDVTLINISHHIKKETYKKYNQVINLENN